MVNENYNLLVTAKLKAAQFNSGIRGMNTRIRSFSSSITGLNTALIALPFAAVGVAAVNAASELESAERRFKISFGNLEDYGNQFQQGITDALGRSRTEIISSMVSFKQFFQGLGYGSVSAGMLSKKMAGLSIDLAAFFNISDQQASKRFLAALAGSPEVLDQFGINLKEAAVKQELLNMGITVGVQRASEYQKTIARLNIIDKVMGKNGIIGFAAKNTDLFSNRLRELKGRITELSASFGKELLPIASKVVTKLSDLAKSLSQMSTIDKQRIMGLAIALGAIPIALSGLSSAVTIFSGFITILGGSTATIMAAAAAFFILSEAMEKYQNTKFMSNREKELLEQFKGSDVLSTIKNLEGELEKIQDEYANTEETAMDAFGLGRVSDKYIL
jgi:hypothetical protein